MTYRFCVLKNNGNNVKCTAKGEKSNKCYARNHTILFVPVRGTAQEYFCSYQSLHSSKKNHSAKEKFQIKSFYKIINQSKFLFTTLSRLRCLKH